MASLVRCFRGSRTIFGAGKPMSFAIARAFGTAEASRLSPVESQRSTGTYLGLAALIGGGAYIYYQAVSQDRVDELFSNPASAYSIAIGDTSQVVRDYAKVREAIEDLLDAEDHDDGSYGPILVRLAWHSAGTYDVETGTGGSNGAGMRFPPESTDGANAGLHLAREVLEPVKKKFPWISYSDLWTLAGCTAIEAMGGPTIPWRPGRSDFADNSSCPPNGRLPDASQGADHIRNVFYRMGFSDQEIVALSGAHALGRCHATSSGYVNPWTRAPTTFSNEFFVELINNKWRKKKWDGPEQYEDPTGELMMLPTDMVLIWDRKFKPYVVQYAKDSDKFFEDFAAAFQKLMELGVPFPEQPASK